MSDAFRKSILNRLPPMAPTKAPWASSGNDEEELEEDDGDSLGDLGASLPTSSGSSSRKPQQDLSPISASDYFQQALEVSPDDRPITFRVYYTASSPPLSLTASSSQSQGQGAAKLGNQGRKAEKGTALVCHHGAGSSGLSFAALAKEIRDRDPELGVLAFDARGHGKTRTKPTDLEHDLSLKNLTNDLVSLILKIFPDPTEAPSLLMMGHSMGASPSLSAAEILRTKGYTIPGVIVLDVVEGTAVESLPLMKGILSQRPSNFNSVIDGIQWHLTSHSIRNPISARISVPSYLQPAPDVQQSGPQSRQIWRADLLAMEPYWSEWWEGLSQKFLVAKCARLLVLAGQERLDKDLMVGQMQGKFQLEVMQNVGHYLHEDDPATLAATLIAFWRRNTKILVLPPKIGSNPGSETGVTVKRVGEN